MGETKGEATARPTIVDASDPVAMRDLIRQLEKAPRLALDTESDPFHRYFEKVCLIQLASPDLAVILDPLPGGLAPELVAFLADPARTFVLHGADYDVRSLRRAFGLTLGRIFDSSIAAMLLGEKELGLKALLEKHLGVVIEKTEQRSDWGQRPLRPEQLAYAMGDVCYLLELAERLQARLEEAGRTAWMEEECRALRLKTATERVFDPESWRKITGVRALGPSGQKVARALHLWRESVARDRDVPPFRVMGNALILEMAKQIQGGASVASTVASRTRRFPAGVERGWVEQVIQQGLSEQDPVEPTLTSEPSAEHFSREVIDGRLERMRAVRAERAAVLGLDPGFLISGNVLKRIARMPSVTLADLLKLEGMSAWRAEVVGQELLAVLCL